MHSSFWMIIRVLLAVEKRIHKKDFGDDVSRIPALPQIITVNDPGRNNARDYMLLHPEFLRILA